MLDMVPLRETQVFKDLFAEEIKAREEERKAYEDRIQKLEKDVEKNEHNARTINSLRDRVGRGEIDAEEFQRLLFEHFDRGEI